MSFGLFRLAKIWRLSYGRGCCVLIGQVRQVKAVESCCVSVGSRKVRLGKFWRLSCVGASLGKFWRLS